MGRLQYVKLNVNDGQPRCLACLRTIANPPEAKTSERRGPFDVIIEWRICKCGAFLRRQRIRRAPSRERAEG